MQKEHVKFAAERTAMAQYGLEKVALPTTWSHLKRHLGDFKDMAGAGAKWMFTSHKPPTIPGPGVAEVSRHLWSNPVTKDFKNTTRAKELLKGLGRTAGEFGLAIPEFIRETALGSPLTLAKELEARREATGSLPKAMLGHLKNWYIPDSVTNNMRGSSLWYKAKQLAKGSAVPLGWPAYDAYQTLKNSDEDHRGADIGRVGGILAASPFTARLGIPGLMLTELAATGGGAIGGLFDKSAPTPTAMAYNPGHHGRLVAKGLFRSGGFGDNTPINGEPYFYPYEI